MDERDRLGSADERLYDAEWLYPDTAGPPPNYPYTRVDYTSDASGCVRYDAVTAGDTGQYTIDVQQAKGWRLTVVDEHVFTVQNPVA